VNTALTNDQANIKGAGVVYTNDSSSGNVMLDITNNNAFDYGCTDVSVSRSGTGAQTYNGSVSPDLAMDKTFTITPSNTTTSGNANVVFYFELAEITGWEGATGQSRNNLVAYREGTGDIVSLTVGTFGSHITLTGDFTGLSGKFLFGTNDTFQRLTIGPKVFLQGAALNPNTGEETLMRDDLRVAGIIPTTSPYADALTCNASVFTPTGNNAIVDWIWIELRDKSDNTSVLLFQSALLQRDGDIVAVDGVSPITFKIVSGNYYVAIKHRNHMGVISANTIALTGNTSVLSFTDANNQIAFGSNAQTTSGMPSGVVGMWSGDAGGDGRLNYSGGLSDVPTVRSQVFNDPNNSFLGGPPVASYPSQGYYKTDVNMDGVTVYSGAESDVLLIRNNIFNNSSNSFLGGPPTSTYIFIQQLPEGAN